MPQYQELKTDKIWSMLSAIDAHDREDWYRVGMALKAHVGDAGWPLFDVWSQTADNYKASEARSVWRSFRGSGVGIGTLVYMAKKNGWSKNAPTHQYPHRGAHPSRSNPIQHSMLRSYGWVQTSGCRPMTGYHTQALMYQ
jgi:hypothetical protein